MLNQRITILYGSQTGTAQEVAERIWRELKRFYFHGPVKAMDDYLKSQLIYEPVVVFVCSTTGQGEEPDNMKQFWKFLLRKNLPTDSLSNMKYAVLGLGDSSYLKFNYVAKKLNRRLLQLGGQPLIEIGLGDDQHDLGSDAVVDPWISNLCAKLCNLYPLPAGVQPISEDQLCLPRWQTSVIQQNGIDRTEQYSQNDQNFASIIKNSRTTAMSHFQDVRLIEMAAPDVEYSPGDVLMVCPHNAPDKVDQFFTLLNSNEMNANMLIEVKSKDNDIPVPVILQKCLTLRKCAEQYWDLSIRGSYFKRLLAHFSTSEMEKEKLIEFTTAEGQEELYNYCNRPRRTTLEVLQDFPHATSNITLEYLFELLQPIRPRAFSIASSPQAHKGEIHILVAVVKYQTKLKVPRLGLCSNWLASLSPGIRIPISIRRGIFHFPKTQNIPVIMIGPGTGVAPFRSYIYHRVALQEASNELLYLFFGCRNKNGDFHCSNEWMNFRSSGHLTLFCAFSRDQEHKIYVQNLIKEQAKLMWDLLQSGAWIFVAGNSKDMPAGVKDAFIQDVVSKIGKHAHAEEFVKQLENSGRYQTETWS
ncbi:hypothetical protein L9F63_003002, partial [Diploptera punctata]